MEAQKTRDIFFTLVVDDFAVKYTAESDANHLLTTPEKCMFAPPTGPVLATVA
jgi:hypothetical protein